MPILRNMRASANVCWRPTPTRSVCWTSASSSSPLRNEEPRAMAQLSLRERLQPALFDRLLDDERLLTVYELSFRRAELRRLGIAERELAGILIAQGLRLAEDAGAATDDILRLSFTAPAGKVSLSHLKALVLKPPGLAKDTAARSGVALQALCEIAARNVVNDSAETGELKAVSMRKLREYVCRDL